MSNQRHYWGYRIDKNNIPFFESELRQGRLRQGWGYEEGQNLRNMTYDGGAKRNLAILNKVKKGDILLVPRLPTYEEVAIIEATEDFDIGYQFSIDPKLEDYGHIFPAKLIKQFVRNNENIAGKIRATMGNVSRFWNIDHCGEDIEALIKFEDHALRDTISFENRFLNNISSAFNKSFDEDQYISLVYENMLHDFSNQEWEYALVEGLKKMLPHPITVERTGGILEYEHGTDILIRLPSLLGTEYLIAIQVKDYNGIVNHAPLKQLAKAEQYWNSEGNKLIDKILIITKSIREENLKLLENEYGIKIIFAKELKELIGKIADSYFIRPN